MRIHGMVVWFVIFLFCLFPAIVNAEDKGQELIPAVRSGAINLIPEAWQGKRFFPSVSNRVHKGSAQALVTIVEYTDFQCPYCEAGAKIVEEVLERYEGQVKLVVKHLPLETHPAAMPAALYFEAIARQDTNKAWLFYQRMFQKQDRLKEGEGYLRQVAAELAVNMRRLEEDLRSPDLKARIEADVKEADTYGFDGVPVFIIDGRLVDGAHSFATFCRMVDEAILAKQH